MARLQNEPITYSDFTGGINKSVSGELIAENEMQFCNNMEYTEDGYRLKRRGGLSEAIMTFPSPIMGAYYDFEMNTYIVSLMNKDVYKTDLNTKVLLGKLTGGVKPIHTKYGGKVLIASGEKLQSYDYINLITLEKSPRCDIVFERFGRVAVGKAGDDYVHYSAVGDETGWEEQSHINDTAKEIEVGYKDGGDIVWIKNMLTDIYIAKSNGKLYQLSNEYPDWQVVEVNNNLDCDYRFAAESVGNDILFVNKRGLHSIAATATYGNVQVQDVGHKFSALFGELYHPTLWNIKRKKVLLIRPNDGNTVIAYYYQIGAALTMTFPEAVVEVLDTPDGVVVAAGSSLHYWSDYYAADYGTIPVVASMSPKKVITPERMLVSKIDLAITNSAGATGSVKVKLKDLIASYSWVYTDSYFRRSTRCNYRVDVVDSVVESSDRLILNHLSISSTPIR